MQENEQSAIAVRNARRRELCVEYANVEARREAIIAELTALSYEANKAAAAIRIDGASRAITPQADIIRCNFLSDGVDGLPGQWNKPVEVKP